MPNRSMDEKMQVQRLYLLEVWEIDGRAKVIGWIKIIYKQHLKVMSQMICERQATAFQG